MNWWDWMRDRLREEKGDGPCAHKQLAIRACGSSAHFLATCTVCGAELKVSAENYALLQGDPE